MAVKTVFAHEIYYNIGLSTDTKPTGQSSSSKFIEYDTGLEFITYDGTNWVRKADRASGVLKEVRVAKAIDASIGAYTANDVVNDDDCSVTATYWTFAAVARANDGYGAIVGATIFSESESVTPRLTLYLFNAAPTGELTDNSANTNPIKTDRAKYIGQIDFPALESVGTAASVAIASPSTVGNLPLLFKTVTVDDIYGVLVTRDAFTQTATDDIEIVLLIEQY